MRVLDGEQLLARIFIGESDRWHHQPLAMALLERLRREASRAPLSFTAPAGSAARSVLHSSHLLRLSEDLPVVIEVVDTEEHIDRLLPILDEMVTEGLVTLERVRVVKYAPGERPLKA